MLTSQKPLNNDAVASMLGIAPTMLRIWRIRGIGPQFTKLGPAKQSPVIYYEEDVKAWLDERKFASTSAYGKYPNCPSEAASH